MPGSAVTSNRPLGSIGVPSWVVDDQVRIRWENARARELFGRSRGRSIQALVAPGGQQRVQLEIARKLLGGSSTSDYRTTLQLASGEQVPVEIHSVALSNGQRVVGVFGVAELDLATTSSPVESQLTPLAVHDPPAVDDQAINREKSRRT